MFSAVVSGTPKHNKLSIQKDNIVFQLCHLGKPMPGVFTVTVCHTGASQCMEFSDAQEAIFAVMGLDCLTTQADALQIQVPSVQGLYKFGEVRFVVDKYTDEILLLPSTYNDCQVKKSVEMKIYTP